MELREGEAIEVEGAQGITESGKVCSTWARLIQKVFEIDPLTCNKCGGEMRIIAFISTQSEIRKILKHIDDETIRPPPLTRPGQAKSQEVVCEYTSDYVPTTDDYLCDPVYPD
ncbi:MAG: hypothetical protein HQK84_09375 [Nitrospinae bacterium]|nr:hypothetical protein [Nitrospinota bacterium]